MKHHIQTWFCYRALAVFLCFLLSPLPQFAQSNHAGSISALRTSATKNAGAVKAKDPINWNDVLKTDATGRMRIALDDGSLLSVGTDSQLRVVQHNARAQQSQLELNLGRLRSQVVKLTQPGSRFEVRTPTAVAGVIGTDFFLDVTPTATHLVVYEGFVVLTPIIAGVLQESQQITVRAGQSADVNENGISGPTATPPGVADQTIAETTIENISKAKVAGTAGSHVLRNTLIVLGIAGAVAGAGIAASQSGGSSNNTNQQIPPR
jgi:FecR protein